jgi:fructosamine-3-kinase
MQNPLFEFQRSALDPTLNPNMHTEYPKHFRNGYRSVRNIHPDFEHVSKILQRYLCSIRHRRRHRPTRLDPTQPAF